MYILKTIRLYYDDYEKKYGDGFYPQIHKDASCSTEIDIDFALINGELVQLSGDTIHGYDGDTYSSIIKMFYS
jgi:hypothetical protein